VDHGPGPASRPVSRGEETPELLARFAELLRASPHNLLSPRGLDELEARHFPESLRFAQALPAGRRLLDVGSGGGLPGLVIAIERPDLEVHLLEATGKKAEFLAEAGAELGIPVTVHRGRAEELASGPLRGTFDLVTARAVAPLERLVPWTRHYLAPRGQLHAIKGERWEQELVDAEQVIRTGGLRVLGRPGKGALSDPSVVVLERPR